MEKHHTLLSDVRPRTAPALELLSRAASSVGVCTVPAVPTQGTIPKGGYKKNKAKKKRLDAGRKKFYGAWMVTLGSNVLCTDDTSCSKFIGLFRLGIFAAIDHVRWANTVGDPINGQV